MINIPKRVYKQLLDDTVKLQKANDAIAKLNQILRQKSDELKELKNRKSQKCSEEMDFASEILFCLGNGKQDKKYSENIRQFCMALSYYSPNAYRYVRSVFKNNLPHPRTMRAWLSSIDASPGVTAEALNTLEIKAKEYEAQGKELLIAMISDEVSIKKKIEWVEAEHKFSGFITCRDEENKKKQKNKGLPVAKNALVFMAVGADFKISMAYFLLTGLNALGRAALTQLTIKSVNNTGARVISLTQMNCTRSNFAKTIWKLGFQLSEVDWATTIIHLLPNLKRYIVSF
ncbi:uncharacterized protein LOC129573448 [Sitodiplosis mosellana]|uniref:uncharacterized protein LOC129573448 n=1 Tax=Sitodiplosis mosellana TaxID=263140 RepID=UPI00244444CA|nr:uncharacterized protein LOC129573448 [Sitodiplosis mosellana]